MYAHTKVSMNTKRTEERAIRGAERESLGCLTAWISAV